MNFPALENKIYLDTARSGLMYDDLLKWRKEHENDFLINGSQFRVNHESFLDMFNTDKIKEFLVEII